MEKEKILLEKSKKFLQDVNRQYFENTFKIYAPQKVKDLNIDKFNFEVWETIVNVPDEQFGGQSPYFIFFRNDTLEPFMFHDSGAEGRTPNLEILQKNGKYEIGDEWKG
ncbi:hypothetical protein [Chryseobacterium sp.]|uniref:hypothetical protein n=1 Tax=Chryseobacterium sp. TaxID=1871047 RepID=UPI0011CBE547|nr:hypothetical protein [Chryseobacterium sp.]TXF79488.1 hypothetical protein FUA25_03650 [Chryseobacterium sp.]